MSEPNGSGGADGPELERAEALLEAGNWREARRLARQVLLGDADEETRERARRVLERIRPDPVAVAAAVGCALLLGVVAALTLGR